MCKPLYMRKNISDRKWEKAERKIAKLSQKKLFKVGRKAKDIRVKKAAAERLEPETIVKEFWRLSSAVTNRTKWIAEYDLSDTVLDKLSTKDIKEVAIIARYYGTIDAAVNRLKNDQNALAEVIERTFNGDRAFEEALKFSDIETLSKLTSKLDNKKKKAAAEDMLRKKIEEVIKRGSDPEQLKKAVEYGSREQRREAAEKAAEIIVNKSCKDEDKDRSLIYRIDQICRLKPNYFSTLSDDSITCVLAYLTSQCLEDYPDILNSLIQSYKNGYNKDLIKKFSHDIKTRRGGCHYSSYSCNWHNDGVYSPEYLSSSLKG